MFSFNIKPQYIPARYFSFCVLLTVLLVTLSIRSLQGELFITDAQYMVAAGRWIIANGHLPTTDPLSIHSELTYICQQYPICILVAVLYDTFGEMSVRLFFALLDMVAVLFIWYQTFPKAGNRISDHGERINRCRRAPHEKRIAIRPASRLAVDSQDDLIALRRLHDAIC